METSVSNIESHGKEPGFVAGMTFSMVVVAGNALMRLGTSRLARGIPHLFGFGLGSFNPVS